MRRGIFGFEPDHLLENLYGLVVGAGFEMDFSLSEELPGEFFGLGGLAWPLWSGLLLRRGGSPGAQHQGENHHDYHYELFTPIPSQDQAHFVTLKNSGNLRTSAGIKMEPDCSPRFQEVTL